MGITPNLFGQGLVAPIVPQGLGPLKRRYVMPFFSTWDTRDGDWQDRRRAWLARGIQSEVGRDDGTGKWSFAIPEDWGGLGTQAMADKNVSVFDPVICELAYYWWSQPGALVLDPFAGGSVRGIVASLMDRRYQGVELRPEQVAANRAQLGPPTIGRWAPRWTCGDSLEVLDQPARQPFDLLFSCPPYADLEVYSDIPGDISNIRGYHAFLSSYRAIIAKACSQLADDRFAVWVVANHRDRTTGAMRDFVGDTVRAFEDAGLAFWNDIILINSVGTGASRAQRTFGAQGKIIKLHQNVLVFVKGDARAAFKPIQDALELRPSKEE